MTGKQTEPLTVKSCMKRTVVSIDSTATALDAAALVAKHHIGLLPVVGEAGQLVGVLDVHDLLTLELPDFVKFVSDVDFVHDFGAVETTRPSAAVLSRKVEALMEKPISVDEDAGLLRAYVLMIQRNVHDMPVVSKGGRLIGIISRVDIAAAILKMWHKVEKK